MRHLLVAFLLFVAAAAHAARLDFDCAPQDFGGTGVGYVESPTRDFAAWWCPYRWRHRLNYAIAPPGVIIKRADVSGKTTLAALRTLAAANATAPGCDPASTVTQALCDRMRTASWVTLPPLPDMVVGKATAADGTRPTYLLSADGTTLQPNPLRAVAGAQCSCYWKAFASGASDYCSVAQPLPAALSPMALCVRK